MTDTLMERYRRWFAYEQDANGKTLASLSTVPEAERSSTAFQKAVELFGHILKARRLWLFRFGESDEAIGDLFAQDVNLESLAAFADETYARWSTLLARLDDEQIARTFTYQSLDAGRFRNSMEDILTQLFGHAWYHRGQIAALVKSLGGTPAATDFVYWCREPLQSETE